MEGGDAHIRRHGGVDRVARRTLQGGLDQLGARHGPGQGRRPRRHVDLAGLPRVGEELRGGLGPVHVVAVGGGGVRRRRRLEPDVLR